MKVQLGLHFVSYYILISKNLKRVLIFCVTTRSSIPCIVIFFEFWIVNFSNLESRFSAITLKITSSQIPVLIPIKISRTLKHWLKIRSTYLDGQSLTILTMSRSNIGTSNFRDSRSSAILIFFANQLLRREYRVHQGFGLKSSEMVYFLKQFYHFESDQHF